jgi:hypothetical protein
MTTSSNRVQDNLELIGDLTADGPTTDGSGTIIDSSQLGPTPIGGGRTPSAYDFVRVVLQDSGAVAKLSKIRRRRTLLVYPFLDD